MLKYFLVYEYLQLEQMLEVGNNTKVFSSLIFIPISLQPRLNSSSEELGLTDERSLTVRRLPNSENGPSQVARRQSTPEQGNKGEHSSLDFLSVSVSSPGLLSHASDPGEPQRFFPNLIYIMWNNLFACLLILSMSLNEHLFNFCKLSVNLNVKVREPDVNMSDLWI